MVRWFALAWVCMVAVTGCGSCAGDEKPSGGDPPSARGVDSTGSSPKHIRPGRLRELADVDGGADAAR